jgi:hypothetical protein
MTRRRGPSETPELPPRIGGYYHGRERTAQHVSSQQGRCATDCHRHEHAHTQGAMLVVAASAAERAAELARCAFRRTFGRGG